MLIMLGRIAAFGAASYVTLSFFEWVMHRGFMHRRGVAYFYERVAFLKIAHFRHAVQHHARFYRRFECEPDPVGRLISIDPDFVFTFVLAVPFVGGLAFLDTLLAAVFSTVLVVHHCTWLLFHREMHMPSHSFFHGWRVYRGLARYHWMHHRYRSVNFNLVFPFADFIPGTYKTPGPKDIESMLATRI